MKAFFLTCAFVSGILAGSTLLGSSMAGFIDDARAETLGAYCEAGHKSSCEELVLLTGGNCSGPVGSGCGWGLDIK